LQISAFAIATIAFETELKPKLKFILKRYRSKVDKQLTMYVEENASDMSGLALPGFVQVYSIFPASTVSNIVGTHKEM